MVVFHYLLEARRQRPSVRSEDRPKQNHNKIVQIKCLANYLIGVIGHRFEESQQDRENKIHTKQTPPTLQKKLRGLSRSFLWKLQDTN
jgi:hypothetical protein